jgi:hypothetical protein
MARVAISFYVDNDAFQMDPPDFDAEIEAVMERIADTIKDMELGEEEAVLDSNGNSIGVVSFLDEDDEDDDAADDEDET